MGPLIRRYLVIVEKCPAILRGFAPDIPVCAESGRSMEDLRERMHDAIEAYLRGLMLRGHPIPEPSVGPEDVGQGTLAEWMVIRLRSGATGAKDMLVRAWPSR